MKNKKNIKLAKVIMLTLAIIGFNTVSGQVLPKNSCPSPNGSDMAHFGVKFFLTMAPLEYRVESGTMGISINEIRPVSNETICGQLNNIVRGNPKLKNVDDNTTKQRNFYRTNNFYYIFWTYNNVRTGPKTIFTVISFDFQTTWEYYL